MPRTRVLLLIKDTGQKLVLYDGPEMFLPPVNVSLSQREFDEKLPTGITLRRAIVVPNTKLAYLARLAFGEGDYRVFYNDGSNLVAGTKTSILSGAASASATQSRHRKR